MDIETAKKNVGLVVASDCDIWGAIEYVKPFTTAEGKPDGWVGVRELSPVGSDRKGRLDEIQASRLFPA